ncbi:hypothetical protein C1X05_00215 [Laceyella sacchari]|uniref:Alanine racemase n=1 Tax=Laceyella tengchongensis TaxID=574699 RepID=A0AA46AG89_9BACL|nr:hypothetical protein [Laceyella tengchongensis]AUS07436.1 hypothetical protein C1X05_00215 [Laceyella sacchari]SMP24766.1 Alanine racemase [Laceyella tengchongensis]
MNNNLYLRISLDTIKSNIRKLTKQLPYRSSLFMVCKNNVYGFGMSLLSHLANENLSFVLNDWRDYQRFVQIVRDSKPVLILYPVLNDDPWILTQLGEHSNLYITVMKKEDWAFVLRKGYEAKSYVRIDPFLGLHGLSKEEAMSLPKVHACKGVLIHLNESINAKEEAVINEIYQWTKKNNMSMNIGGSNIINKPNLHFPFLEVRLLMELLGSRNRVTEPCLELHARILSKTLIREPIHVGYTSSRVKLSKGTCLLVAIGYGDFPSFAQMFENQTPIFIERKKFVLPCYPCMNTSWLYCEEEVFIRRESIVLFDKFNSIHKLALNLSVDVDEIYSSLSPLIYRHYV